MIHFRKTVSKFGTRRIIEVPVEYYDVIQIGDKVIVTKKEEDKKK